MKKLLSTLFSTLQGGLRGGPLILALLATTSLWAYDFQSGDLYYNITSDSTVAVTYQEYNSSSNYASIYTVTVPETVTYDGTTYSVTSIGKYAFYDCSSLVSVTIPNSVTHIGDHAFYKTSSLTSVNIPNSVTSIGDYAFRGCSSLTAIDIPNSLTKIAHGMFQYCSSLATVTIPNSVTSIDTWAFSSCTSLTSITIPNSVTRIGSFAFEYCRSLTAITIPESVTDIGSGAFESCSSLTSVVWNAKKCGQAYNYGYTHFEIELMDSTNYSYEEIGEFVKYFLDEGNIINNSPFHDCDGIKSFSFGENVEFIPEGLCYGLDGITSITIPESVSSIGERSFGECSSLDTIYCYSKDLPIMYLTDLHVHIVNIEMVYTYDEATPYIYDNTILYVPCQLLDAYKSQEEYTIRFPNIQCLEEDTPSQPQDQPTEGIGVFSVGEGKTVTFSPGNLQYTQSTDTWSFARVQYEVIGTNNVIGDSVSSHALGKDKDGTELADKIDLFGWSTSANNFGVTTSTNNNDYSGSFVDWGTNKIGNDAPNTWRTLTNEEWDYLLNNRKNASSLCGIAQVKDVNGLIILPDNWICPADITFKSGFTGGSYSGVLFYGYQTFSVNQWSKLEAAGAIFLPAAGGRYSNSVHNVQYSGRYWSATECNNDQTYYTHFDHSEVIMDNFYRYTGKSVRLVKDINSTTPEPPTPSDPQDTTIYHPTDYATICEGETYTWMGMDYTEAGRHEAVEIVQDENYTYHHIYTLELTVIPFSSDTIVVEAYDSYEWHGKVYTESGTYIYEIYENFCSIEVLELTIIDTPTPPEPEIPTEGIGVFSVGEGKTVTFSPGNLQYHPANDEWRFAENQTDYIGSANSNISATYSGWLDLFGWGTGDVPTKSSESYSDYKTFVDWGTNKISNDAPNTWRTLSNDEWGYIFYNRPNAQSLFALGSVNGVNGTIILPDNWTTPVGVSFVASTTKGLYWNRWYYYNSNDNNFSHNTYTSEQWVKMEQEGAVFLPASGNRWGTSVTGVGNAGYYWSTTEAGMDYAHYVVFTSDELYPQNHFYFHKGHSVRLVKDISNTTPEPPVEPQDTTIYSPTEGIGVFSIGEGKTVTFSLGNLQYHPANDEWRFAENQTDYIGSANSNISATYSGWLDLFGWGTGNAPTKSSTDYSDYQTFVDWGTNKIGNDASNTWRTLTYDEWDYLRYNRTNANDLCGVAQVNGVNGLIFLPDNWTCPAGVAFKSGFYNSYGVDYYAAYQTFTAEQWSKMEAAGAIFLPAASRRYGSDVGSVQFDGYYWSATEDDDDSNRAYYLYFSTVRAGRSSGTRDGGRSVRLVKDISSTTPEPPVEPQDTTIYHPTEYATICEGTTFVWMGMEFTEIGTYTYEEIVEDENYIYHYIHTLELQVIAPPEPDTIVVEAYDSYEWHGVVYTESGTYIYEEHCYQEILQLTIIDTPTPPEPEIPTEGIGVFSIGEGKTVIFSRGNLQYTQSTNTWSFAENQYEYLGEANIAIDADVLADKVDLFGWSTSATYFGVSTSEDYDDYSGSFVDWGTNKIGNDAPNTWRTLTYDEWDYLLEYRNNASSLCGVAQVNGVNGLIFLPDKWTCPAGVTFKSGFHSSYGTEYYAAYQTFTAEQWSKLEAAGAIFLPAAGRRDGSSAGNVQNFGYCWSATEYYSNFARSLYFRSDEAGMGNYFRNIGLSVRLVKDVNNTTPEPPVEPEPEVITITHPVDTATICEYETYTWHGNEYNQPGAYTVTETVEDEDYTYHHIYTLELTVIPFSSDTIVVEAYDSYEWHGMVYTESGTYIYEIYENFCSIEVLELTIIDTPTPPEPEIPTEGIGVFSIGEGKTVTFSRGNLQYTQSTNTWSFAENQWDYIGTDNVTGGSVSSNQQYGDNKYGDALADKIDLFGWSTSATNFGVSTSEDIADYYGSFVDWGTNKIGNDAPNTWRTLTYDEWNYLRYNRTNADNLVGVAQVNGVNGLILLPDNWTCPDGVTFKSGFHSNYGVDYYAAYQTFTADQWSKLESAGAVFLPAAGNRYGSDVGDVQNYGDYRSATEGSSYDAGGFYFYSGEADMGNGNRNSGLSVRLVKDVNSTTPEPPVEPEPEVITITLPVDTATICEYETYTWHGNEYNQPGAYTVTEIVEEEDYIYHIIYTLELTVLPSETKEFFHNVMVCSNELPYYWWVNGEYGQYEVRCEKEGIYQHFENQECSENIYTLHLTVHPSETIETEVEAYDSYEWHGVVYTESGTYTYYDNCSEEILHLTIIDTPTIPTELQDTIYYADAICEGETYIWWGMEFTETGTYTCTYEEIVEDEDYIYIYRHLHILYLTVLPYETIEYEVEAYDSYVWYGEVYTESGVYTYRDPYNCVIEELHLTIIPSEDNQGEVVVEPSTNSVTITWQKEDDADTYIIVIKQGDKVVCTLIFDAEGNLVSVNYLPGRESNKHGIQHAGLTSDSFQYTITGLTPSTDYTYTVTAMDDSDNTISSYSGEFTTHHATSVENTNSQSPTIDCQKILYEDHIYILRDGKIYSIMGQEM